MSLKADLLVLTLQPIKSGSLYVEFTLPILLMKCIIRGREVLDDERGLLEEMQTLVFVYFLLFMVVVLTNII